MKYDKTTIVGVAICVILLLMWMGHQNSRRPPARARAAEPSRQGPAPAAPLEPAPSAPVAAESPAPPPVETKPPASQVPATSADMLEAARKPWPVPEDAPVSLVSVDGSFVLRIDPNGGGITGVVLNDYFEDAEKGGHTGTPVQLGRPELPFCALNLAQAGWTGGDAEILEQGEGRLSIRRMVVGPGGATAQLTETWSMVDAPYQFDYALRLDAAGEEGVALKGLALEGGGLPPTTSKERAKFRGASASGIMCATIGSKRPQGFDIGKMAKMKPVVRENLRTAPTEWLAVHSQYFLFHLAAPEGSSFRGTIPTLETLSQGLPEDKWYRGRALLPELEVASGGSATLSFRCYAGPKKLQLLAELPGRVDKVMGIDSFMFMDAAWMGWLTKLLLSCMVGLKAVFSGSWGYGWAIIVITIAVKVVFFPLSHKSTQSMRKMQELQPQLKALREQYKDDPQKMYRKQQELFKENNVSQLGGCLPMLVQIPVFFALYNTFRSAIELRQAGFLWVADLSLPDTLAFSPEALPIRPLALIMSGSMLLQNKLTPTGDPSQQRMMMFMSLFMLWIFYGMPAGLTLYWTTNQILTIGQTLLTRRLEEKKKAALANSGAAAAKSV